MASTKTSCNFSEDLQALDQKWLVRLSRLEALIISKTRPFLVLLYHTHYDLDSDTDIAVQPTEQLSPIHAFAEEGEFSDQEASVSVQESDELLSEEHTF